MNGLDERIPFTKVPNRILDEVISKLSGSEFKILMTICRSTFGFHKKRDKISISQMVDATGLAKSTVIDALHKLTQKKIIKKNEEVIPHEYLVVESNQQNLDGPKKQPDSVRKSNQPLVRKPDTQKKPSKEKKDTTISSSEFSEKLIRIAEYWNNLFYFKILNHHSDLLDDIEKSLHEFSEKELKKAMTNRSGAKFYENRYALKHNPKCFFPYPDTIRADLHRTPADLFEYEQMIDRVTGGQNEQSDFEMVSDIKDDQGRAMWKLKS
ncbi:replication protein [Rhodohalobacter sulfatireducens]|uniref:Replication protein n=1 Tax=Rhodohalobacter sulfatireducens TaxID=2911366 RepID=A0ABS9KFA5_9BACT|nr:replication protein [Rhodohalobacter sulfatireducens]MCG2589527.1 replication protein [Rhodohalobacter sulfatireducens]